jgi:hypothetical protein
MYSDPTIDDSDRAGSDLLARIEELTPNNPTGNGWRPLLVACRKQIARLRDELDRLTQRGEDRDIITTHVDGDMLRDESVWITPPTAASSPADDPPGK